MTPAAQAFVDQVRKIDGPLADLIGAELERGANLYAMIDMLQAQLAAKRSMDRLRQSARARQSADDID